MRRISWRRARAREVTERWTHARRDPSERPADGQLPFTLAESDTSRSPSELARQLDIDLGRLSRAARAVRVLLRQAAEGGVTG